jgi:hypothetical protein
MALGIPVVLNQFWDKSTFRIRSASLILSDVRSQNMTKGGLVLDSVRSFRLWGGTVEVVPMTHADAVEVDTLMSFLTEAGTSFLCYDKRNPRLRSDPTGAVAGITLSSVSANRKEVNLAGFPANFFLQAGDAIGYTYSSAPTRYAYHRVVRAPNLATGAGLITAVEVTPPIRDGFILDQAITVNKAVMKAKVVQGSLKASVGQPGKSSSGVSFDFMQTFGV